MGWTGGAPCWRVAVPQGVHALPLGEAAWRPPRLERAAPGQEKRSRQARSTGPEAVASLRGWVPARPRDRPRRGTQLRAARRLTVPTT